MGCTLDVAKVLARVRAGHKQGLQHLLQGLPADYVVIGL